jgi:hypothetical protein
MIGGEDQVFAGAQFIGFEIRAVAITAGSIEIPDGNPVGFTHGRFNVMEPVDIFTQLDEEFFFCGPFFSFLQYPANHFVAGVHFAAAAVIPGFLFEFIRQVNQGSRRMGTISPRRIAGAGVPEINFRQLHLYPEIVETVFHFKTETYPILGEEGAHPANKDIHGSFVDDLRLNIILS